MFTIIRDTTQVGGSRCTAVAHIMTQIPSAAS